jgi:hypothetical protein
MSGIGKQGDLAFRQAGFSQTRSHAFCGQGAAPTAKRRIGFDQLLVEGPVLDLVGPERLA